MQGYVPLFYSFHFYLFGFIALVSALLFVTRKSPVAAAMWLVNVMFSLAALYVLMDAHFVGAIQVLVYAGAIMVVFLFVVMLLNLGHADAMNDRRGLGVRLTAGLVAVALLAEIAALTRPSWIKILPQQLAPLPPANDAIGPIAGPLFGEYLLAFELTSVLILAAIVGAVVLGRRSSQ
ncbi:MAG TPA: NADH-quinone oxidoreductase subunit J [Gemmatimonadaceae bacterium]|nr:NADH-quinone oxidoreductase subunit J [Gemmatimonadaceae bacterium]